MTQTCPFYKIIVSDYLHITYEFLQEHADSIRERLNFAAAAGLYRERGDIFAINQCLHLAGSLCFISLPRPT